ncbi:unnamed protein product [Rotaria sordida]|uniref:Amino acid permease/ SLC12A domain-containing protein n=1 Tax=Rotaria sordida TaxID=392033 RepID=A0A814DTN4_9BILA|nr:unnamed protein product [Rotaria sordida]CAF0962790.1 unnamed protein product [Rotaria sordida]CAF1043925.1 unnamed protein product [Rotaria sordida]CAF1215814.1 unnamed protein product [Rotaria sordida]CAF3764033.1 unnamed protein product [Rotaria sordida]
MSRGRSTSFDIDDGKTKSNVFQIDVISQSSGDNQAPDNTEIGVDDNRILISPNRSHLHRNLKERHMIMIALGGTIGTGLFLASGQALASSGPAGSLISYVVVSIMVYFVMTSLAELSTQYPISGSFNTFGSRFVDEAFGFALAYNYYFTWITVIAGELVAAGIIVQYWLPNSPSVVWSLLGMIIMFLLNAFTVKSYGEAEYWFAMIKVVTVIIFIIIGILVDAGVLGHDKIGVRNWKIDGAPFYKGFAGIVTTTLVSGFAFGGTEAVGITAGESANPRRDVPRAMNGTIWRIILFFIGSIFIMGLIIPYNDPNLIHNDVKDIAVSPFTLVFVKSGLKPAVHVMNAIILTTILSAGNSGLYVCTRILYALASEGKAPKQFTYVTRHGIPIWSLLCTVLISTILFGISFIGNKVIYRWLVNITGVMGFIAWFGISLAHWRFRRAYILQGYSLNDLVYKALLFPAGPIMATILICISILGQGYSAFTTHPFNFSNFLAAYITLPVFLIVFLVYKFVKKTRFIPLREIDLVTDNIMFHQNEPTSTI